MARLSGKSIAMLAADLAAGLITEEVIKDELGQGILNSVLAIGGGFVAGAVAQTVLSEIDHHTGIVSDIGSVIDDVLDLF